METVRHRNGVNMTVSVRRAIMQIINDPINVDGKHSARWNPQFGWHAPWEHMELQLQYELREEA